MDTDKTTSLLPISIYDGSLRISSVHFAQQLGIHHKSLLETIRTHQRAIEEGFGRVAFETAPSLTPGGTQQTTVAHLTEEQAAFVATLSRNSPHVVAFKRLLVKSFMEARHLLGGPNTSPNFEKILLNQAQVIGNQQEELRHVQAQLNELRAYLDPIKLNEVQAPRSTPNDSALREMLIQTVDRYSERWNDNPDQSWQYVYKRLLVLHGVDVRRLYRAQGATDLDAIEKHGHLEKLWAIVSLECRH